jgi:hypothetical protein
VLTQKNEKKQESPQRRFLLLFIYGFLSCGDNSKYHLKQQSKFCTRTAGPGPAVPDEEAEPKAL